MSEIIVEAAILEGDYIENPDTKKLFKDIILILAANDCDTESMRFVIDSVNKVLHGDNISPIDVTTDFMPINNKVRHVRNNNILRKDNKIYNETAWNIRRVHYYNDLTKQENPCDKNLIINETAPIYLNKGGIITGEYFDSAEVKTECYKHLDTTKITIPISQIYYNDKNGNEGYVYAMDHRDPALKQLKTQYNIIIKKDNYIHDLKLNIRKYKKLK